MTVVILEGADGSGKSYNCNKLAKEFDWRIFNCGRPTSKQDMQKLLIEFDYMIESKEVFLTDRAPFISEFVYSMVFNTPLLAPIEQLLEYWDKIQEVIYCRPLNFSAKNVSREYKEHKPREFTDKIIQRHERILSLYDDMFNREDLPFKAIRFDGYSDDAYAVLCDYLETHYV